MRLTRIIISLVFSSIILTAYGQQQNYAVVQGNFKSRPNYNISFSEFLFDSHIFYPFKEQTEILLDKDNGFKIKIPVDKSKIIRIMGVPHEIYLEPGDSIMLDIDNKNQYLSVVRYEGIGAQKNRLLYKTATYWEYLIERIVNNMTFYSSLLLSPTNTDKKYKFLLDFYRQIVFDLIKEESNYKVSKEFKMYMENKILYSYMSYLIKFPQLKSHRLYKEEIRQNRYPKLEDDYLSALDSISFNQDEMLPSPEYREFLETYVSYLGVKNFTVNDSLGLDEIGNSKGALYSVRNFNYPKLLDIVEEQFNGKTKFYLSTLFLVEWISIEKDFTKIDPYFSSFMNKCPVTAFTTIVKQQYENYFKILKGKRAPGFTLVNAEGDNISLDHFKGKVVLLEFTFKDCSPCKRELPYAKKLKEELKLKKFELVYITIDKTLKEVEELRAEINEKGPSSAPLLWDKSKEIAYLYGVNGYPTFVLIDQNGIIAATNTKRASSSYDSSLNPVKGGIKDDILLLLDHK